MSISVSLKRVTAVAAAVAFVLSAFAVTSASAATCNFTLNHKLGQTGGEVKSIQQFLNANGFTVATSGAGSAGMETSSFGGKTKAAVMAFQAAKGVSPVSGYWGPLTRVAANASCSGSVVVTPTPTPTAGNAVVAAAPQPGNSLAPANAARVPFTKFTVTAGATPITLNSVTVERGGLASDSAFAGAVLLDDTGAQLGVQQAFNSNHQATVGAAVVIPAGATKTFTVAANMASSTSSQAGQVAVMSVVAVNANGTVAGSLPITGAQHTVNATLAIGTVTAGLSSFDPQSAQNKNIGDTGVRFGGIRITAGSSEDVRFWGVRFRINGSASAADLSNVKINVDGTDYDASVSSDGRYYSAMVPSGIKIEKGFSKDVYVKGDITGSNASGRTVQLDIDRRTDILFTGELYGYGITPTGNAFGTIGTAQTGSALATSSDNPWYQGPDVVISGASVTSIAKASEVPAANVAVNVPSVTLGGFVTDIKGEALNISSMKFDVTYGTARGSTANVLTNVTLVDENGAVVSGPVDEVASSTTAGAVTFTNQVTIPTGRHVYTIKGKVNANIANDSTIVLGTTPSSTSYWTNVTGQTTGNTVSLTPGAFTMNTMTVKGASLAASQASTPVAQTVVAGATDVTFSTIRLDATNSGEDVRVSGFPATIATPANLSSCRVFDGTAALTTGGNVITTPGTSANFTFDNTLVITKGTTKSLVVKCNVNGSASGSSSVTLGTPSTISATGVTSGNTVTVSGSAGTAIAMTIGTGAVAIATDASSPSLATVAGGVSNVTIGSWKLRATNEDVTLQKIGLALTGATANVGNITIWNGSTQVAGPILMTGATQAVTLTTPVTLTKDTDVVLTIKADTSAVGGSNPGTSNGTIAINWNNTAGNNQFTGASSGTAITPTGSTSVAGVRLYKSVPTVADDGATLAATGAADGKLARFKVTANAAGSIAVGKLNVKVTYAAATVANAKVFAFTNASYSTPKSGVYQADGQIAATQATVTSGTAFAVDASATPVQVGAGETVYFEVRGDVVPSTGASVVTVVNGDATLNPAANAALVAAGSVTGNFVWTPNTNGTSAAATTDWVNGADINGLPSSGISKARGL